MDMSSNTRLRNRERVQVVEVVLLGDRHEDDGYREHRLGKPLALNIQKGKSWQAHHTSHLLAGSSILFQRLSTPLKRTFSPWWPSGPNSIMTGPGTMQQDWHLI